MDQAVVDRDLLRAFAIENSERAFALAEQQRHAALARNIPSGTDRLLFRWSEESSYVRLPKAVFNPETKAEFVTAQQDSL